MSQKPWQKSKNGRKRGEKGLSGLYNLECAKTFRIIYSGLHRYRGKNHLFWLSLSFSAFDQFFMTFDHLFKQENQCITRKLTTRFNFQTFKHL